MKRPRWRPAPLLLGSACCHLLCVPALILWPRHWPWPVAALLIDHLLLAGAGLWPRSQTLGTNWTRLPTPQAVAITIDDGPDPEVTPLVLDILHRHRAHATFFCIGERARRHPELIAAIMAAGHAVESHSQRHRLDFSLLGPVRMAREIDEAQHTLARLSGQTPLFFRAPAGLRNPWLDPLLSARGLLLASWTRRGYDTREVSAERVTARLLHRLRGGDILLLHDGNAARTAQGTPVIVAVLPRVLDELARSGLETVTLRSQLE
ncbi:polysaccharide deacetylase family protein [Paludibacterium yongneupense]|uniref:polysaccharide deacetylase family protein n=1 Tax=Paludibacterium yongneupense TaxID=400061 RepID=UPI00041368F1|nr:polysaccharide deacetylase family protein [Paludibacterium yongneupense]